jgi:hypothetical protein
MSIFITARVYRVPSENIHRGLTVRDVLNYEHFELGNDLGELEVPDEVLSDDANNCAWICEFKKDAMRYGEDVIEFYLTNARILAFDDEGGMLVYQKGIQRYA